MGEFAYAATFVRVLRGKRNAMHWCGVSLIDWEAVPSLVVPTSSVKLRALQELTERSRGGTLISCATPMCVRVLGWKWNVVRWFGGSLNNRVAVPLLVVSMAAVQLSALWRITERSRGVTPHWLCHYARVSYSDWSCTSKIDVILMIQ